ncbi:MAG TPA: nuclear transport factor 2 family protein [Jiangellales bacterium]|nr:nuclear transport factor 2 family protein [Jiangellales bacterium]
MTTETTLTVAPTAPRTLVQATAARFLEALAERDLDAILDLLAPDVWLRALLTREVAEARDAAAAARLLGTWVDAPGGREVSEAAWTALADVGVPGRARIRYRFRLRPTWAPDTWHVIEQTGYLRVGPDGRITRLDLACTGYHAEPA